MKVKEWISQDKATPYERAVGGMGGWFGVNKEKEDTERWQAGHRWKDLIQHYDAEEVAYLEAIRESVLEKGLRYTGEQHQEEIDGVPLFEDGKVAVYSWRGWGDLMAAIWSEKEDHNYSYMDFYM